MGEQITVVIKDGKAHVETEGFSGPACRDATRALELAMGRTVADDNTPEFHQKDVQVIGS